MTRKKFIKKMMGHGFSRNEANAFSSMLQGRSFEELYRSLRPQIRRKQISVEVTITGFQDLARAFARVGIETRKLGEALQAIGRSDSQEPPFRSTDIV